MTTLVVDSSALVRRYVADADRALVIDEMSGADVWGASALARTETAQLLHAVAAEPYTLGDLWSRLHADWAAFHVVPVDDRCLVTAADIATRYRLRTVDAVHLAAALRFPGSVRYLTFDHRQLPAAAALGLQVVSPEV